MPMDYMVKVYKQLCREKFSKYGFKNYGNNHYRIINDVFQSFYLHKSVDRMSCTVEFAVIPISVGYSIDKSFCQATHLKMFEGNYEWFKYEKDSKESIDVCIHEMYRYMKLYLMPFFFAGENCEQAYKAVCQFEKQNCKEGIIYASSEKIWMTLKSKKYDMALLHLQALKESTLEAYNKNIKAFGEMGNQYYKKIYAYLKSLNDIEKAIINGDVEYINKLINFNEVRNKRNIIGYEKLSKWS